MTLGQVGRDFAPMQWLIEGWSALRNQAHNALTHFAHDDEDSAQGAGPDSQRRVWWPQTWSTTMIG